MASSLIGTTVDGYRIVDVIGRGGMGTVYKAVDEALDKVVALKMLAPHLAEDTTFLARFRAEAQALARLDAPGIVRVMALRETEQGLFIVMEHVEGTTLQALLRRHAPLPPRTALPLIRQMVEAIAHAHDSDVLHRDLKPSNILITADGTVKITDFGLAKIQAASSDLTSTHETAGTLHYMAPEQIRSLRNVDARSDLFSLGLILYEMLSGRLPFDRTASNYAIQRAIVEEPLPPLATHAEDVPEPLAALVDRLLQKAPDDRWPDAHAVRAALQSIDSPADEPAPPPAEWGTAAVDPAPLSIRLPMLIGLVAVLLVGGTYVAITWLLRPPPDPPSTRSTPPSAPPHARLTVTSTPPGAAMYLNGDSAGLTPLDTLHPTAEQATVRLEMPTYQPFDTTVHIGPGDRTVAAVLTPRSSTARDTLPAAAHFPPADPPTVASAASPDRSPSGPEASREVVPSTDTSASRTEKPSPPRPSATLVVTSTPSGAAVHIGDSLRGTTPLRLANLPAGRYSLTIQAEAHRPFRTTATVDAGDSLRLAPVLTPTPAVLRLRAVPFGTILIDGVPRLQDSDVAWTDSLPPGTYHVRAAYRDFTWTRPLTLEPGATYERVIDFTQTLPVGITAQTPTGERVPNAEVLIDGERRGYLPMQLTLRVGDHTLTVRKNGYQPITRTLTVDAALQGPIVVQLTPQP